MYRSSDGPATAAISAAEPANCCSRTRTSAISGALIASLSIPWGEVKGDEDLGGYHLVWTRDMVNSATGLLAGRRPCDSALRALIYLACSQRPDGGFPQNFWIDGTPYWQGIQLDEVAFPIMLAYRLVHAGATMGLRSVPDGAGGRALPDSRRPGHAAGAMGGE